jgi:hypothetical protein
LFDIELLAARHGYTNSGVVFGIVVGHKGIHSTVDRMLWFQWAVSALFYGVSDRTFIGSGDRIHALAFPVDSGSERGTDADERKFDFSRNRELNVGSYNLGSLLCNGSGLFFCGFVGELPVLLITTYWIRVLDVRIYLLLRFNITTDGLVL